jgi:Rrf2 family cysteine metabolism transcriptional repressor
MRFSKKAEYALRALAVMARQPRSWSIQELSEAEHIPVKFLEQILLALRKAGILASKRGVGGGYIFLKKPEDTSVGEVVQALDGPLAPVPCAGGTPAEACSCPDPRTCAVRRMMLVFRAEMTGWLEARSIEELAKLNSESSGLAFDI